MSARLALAEALIGWFQPESRYLIAFSGGVDSAVVATAAAKSDAICIAVTAVSPSVAEVELRDAELTAKQIGIEHRQVDTSEIDLPAYRVNDGKRCYFCKSTLYSALRSLEPNARIVSGTNLDDLGDYRPGLSAAAEYGVLQPLVDLGIGKAEVRKLAAGWNLTIADKPASPCLASRIAYGVEVTSQRLAMIEQAESGLRELGFNELRVRCHHDNLARVELPSDQLAMLAEESLRLRIVKVVKEAGFSFVTLDLAGLQSGSLNSLLQISLPDT